MRPSLFFALLQRVQAFAVLSSSIYQYVAFDCAYSRKSGIYTYLVLLVKLRGHSPIISRRGSNPARAAWVFFYATALTRFRRPALPCWHGVKSVKNQSANFNGLGFGFVTLTHCKCVEVNVIRRNAFHG